MLDGLYFVGESEALLYLDVYQPGSVSEAELVDEAIDSVEAQDWLVE